jgi:retron-type reverse transcriptase
MSRKSRIHSEIFALSLKTSDPQFLYPVYRRFRRRKHSPEVLTFHAALEPHLAQLTSELLTDTYRHGGYRERLIADKKARRLLIAPVRDRLVHRFLYEFLVAAHDHRFDPDVYSGRRGRGLDKALLRAQTLLARHPAAYAWRTDIHRFFDSVEHDVLLQLLRGHPCWRLCRRVIDSYEVSFGRGIPIGNLTSQIFANLYLHEFDRYVRHTLKPRAYLRYGDDMLLLFPTHRTARLAAEQGTRWLRQSLGLTVNPRNNYLGPAHTLRFLGHLITADSLVADPFCVQKALRRVNFRNLGSYQNLRLPPVVKDALNRQILADLESILTSRL